MLLQKPMVGERYASVTPVARRAVADFALISHSLSHSRALAPDNSPISKHAQDKPMLTSGNYFGAHMHIRRPKVFRNILKTFSQNRLALKLMAVILHALSLSSTLEHSLRTFWANTIFRPCVRKTFGTFSFPTNHSLAFHGLFKGLFEGIQSS